MAMLEISIYSILIWLTAILIVSLDVIVFLGSRSLSSRVFALSSFLTALWSAAQGFFIAANLSALALFIVKLQHFLGIIISLGFLYFSLTYPDDKKPNKKLIPILVVIGVVFFILYFFTSQIIYEVFPFDGIQHWGWTFGLFQRLFDVTFYGLWVSILMNTYRRWKRAQEVSQRTNLRYMFWGLLLGIIPPVVLNVFLPGIGYFRLNWVGPIASAVWIYIIGYSIIKYRQMDVRAFTAEVLAVSMAALMFINIFTNLPFGIYGRALLFLAFAVLVYFLIKNIVTVSVQREELADLTQNLQKRVDEQTKEIRRAYEVEKHARIELQQLNQNKNDFIIITQHHLRTPLAQIRWYANSIASGLYGTVSAELGNAVSRIDNASEKLIRTLNNFLGVVQMKIGVKFLTIESLALKPIIEKLLDEFSSEIEKKRLTVTFPEHDSDWPPVRVDTERIKDALAILIDNAVQYNHEGGNIAIETKRERDRFILRISNTGLGISREDAARLFRQSFFRTKEAKRVNPAGMGVGLLVAKTIIEAHKGSIVLGPSTEKGTTFTLTLPLAG